MKILAIIGSPRKMGNTYRVVEEIREALLAQKGDIDFEYLFLGDQNLQMCKGCFACISKGADKCPLKDDRSAIEQKMLDADGIIIASPTYTKGVPGIMKNFIDRLAYTCHRPVFFDKAFLIVTTVGGIMGMKQALEQLSVLSGGAKLVRKLGVPKPPIPMAGLNNKAKKAIRKTSLIFYQALERKYRKLPGLGDWAWFHSFKSLCSVGSYQKVCPADYAYYKDKTDYFYPIEGHAMSRMVGKVFSGIMKLSLGAMIGRQ